MRHYQLVNNPLCIMCDQVGVTTAATVVDHVNPHKGDPSKFYDADNLQSLCECCHNKHKQRAERSGISVGGDINGFPTCKNHHWN